MQKEIQSITKEIVLHGFFDFGKDAFSTLEIQLHTDRQENIEIIAGEVAKDGKIIHPVSFRTFIQQFVRLEPGDHVIKFNIMEYAPAFGGFPFCRCPEGTDGEIAPFRYVEVNRHCGEVTVRRTAYFCDWDDSASEFISSNDTLNKVWDFCKYSVKATAVFGKYIDGERERLPYEGDAYINQLGHFCCEANYSIARRTIDHFFEFGKFTWPAEWLLLTPMLVRDYLLYSGDQDSVNKWIPLLTEKLLYDCRNEDGLLDQNFYRSPRPGAKVRDLIDWPMSERDGYEVGKINFVPNALLCLSLIAMHELTGDDKYLAEYEILKSAIRKKLFRNGLPVDSENSGHTGLHGAVMALASGVAEPQEVENIREIILNKNMACSVYFAQFLLETCFKYGMAQHAVKLMTSDSDRSWLNMLREGATITMESWGDKWKPNQDWNHAWGAAPANIVTRWLAGIRPTAPGFTEFTVDPCPGNIECFHIRQMTRFGAIELDWSNSKKMLTVPEHTTAKYKGKYLKAGTYSL